MSVFTHQAEVTTFIPFDDPQRIYSDAHELSLYTCETVPRGFMSRILDIPQHRWYELTVDLGLSEVRVPTEEEERAFEETVANNIQHHSLFNTIHIDENGEPTYGIKSSIGVPVRGRPIVSKSTFPIAQYIDITAKSYFFRSVDKCIWNGLEYMYKQIDFDEDISPCYAKSLPGNSY
jgi:hypothetical protein